jgi:hypothetical protein
MSTSSCLLRDHLYEHSFAAWRQCPEKTGCGTGTQPPTFLPVHLAPLQPRLARPLRPQSVTNSGDAAAVALLKNMLLLGARHGHSNLCSGTALRVSSQQIGLKQLASAVLCVELPDTSCMPLAFAHVSLVYYMRD